MKLGFKKNELKNVLKKATYVKETLVLEFKDESVAKLVELLVLNVARKGKKLTLKITDKRTKEELMAFMGMMSDS